MADDLLHRCADRILEVVTDALDDPPARAYVCDGEPTDDCRHVAVWLRSLDLATLGVARGRQSPSLPTSRTAQPRAVFVVQVMTTDCWPVMADDGSAPDPDDITTAAEAVLIDRLDVWNALRTEAGAGTFFDGLLAHGRDGVEIAGPTTTSPQSGGGMKGSRFEVTVHLLREATAGS